MNYDLILLHLKRRYKEYEFITFSHTSEEEFNASITAFKTYTSYIVPRLNPSCLGISISNLNASLYNTPLGMFPDYQTNPTTIGNHYVLPYSFAALVNTKLHKPITTRRANA